MSGPLGTRPGPWPRPKPRGTGKESGRPHEAAPPDGAEGAACALEGRGGGRPGAAPAQPPAAKTEAPGLPPSELAPRGFASRSPKQPRCEDARDRRERAASSASVRAGAFWGPRLLCRGGRSGARTRAVWTTGGNGLVAPGGTLRSSLACGGVKSLAQERLGDRPSLFQRLRHEDAHTPQNDSGPV